MHFVVTPSDGEIIITKSLFDSLSFELFNAFLHHLDCCDSRKYAEYLLERFHDLESDVLCVYDFYGISYGSGYTERFKQLIDERFPLDEGE